MISSIRRKGTVHMTVGSCIVLTSAYKHKQTDFQPFHPFFRCTNVKSPKICWYCNELLPQ